MTAKEKALDLSIKMCSPLDVFKPNLASNRRALIAVDEIIQTHINRSVFITNYWNEVKIEIEKL